MDLIKRLNELTEKGFCPALIFDDDGRWALVFDGAQNVNFTDEPQNMASTFFIEAEFWKDTIEEAVEYSIKKEVT